jgi:bifunctional UDP-N-acetylglucosamine pyrophosphorylase/glucosamine-1-phosphate N-acetyltransferase
LQGFAGDALILYGDTPFIRAETLEKMAAARANFEVVILGFNAANPGRYGRLVMAGDTLEKIVEFANATNEECAITLCNSGVIMANSATLQGLVSQIDNDNASGEYYLTDIVEIARQRGLSATSVTCDESETLGINSRAKLAAAEAAFQTRARQQAQQDGVAMQAPDTVFLAHDTVIGRDAIIEPNVYFGPDVTIESGTHIRAFSHLEGCHVSQGAIVGPFARLRPGAELSENVRVGNFVEIKNAQIGNGAKVNHLSYVGDAEIGKTANLGAGTVTCNYDGVMKHKTIIGEGAFIGSSTMLIAPVKIGANAMTASGSVITKDVPDAALALARAPQINKAGLAKKLFDMLRLKKKKRDSKRVL